MVATRKSSILGPDGRPVEVAVLDGQNAEPSEYGIRRVIEDRQAAGMTPERLARILRSAELGMGRDYLTLAFEMEERYMHYGSQLQTRRLAIEGIDTTVNSVEGVPAKITDAVQALVQDSGFGDMAGDLTDGISKGFGVVEMAWEYEAGALRPVQYEFRDQRYFGFDQKSLKHLRLLTDAQPTYGEELPPYAFVTHFPRTRMGIPLRNGLARPATWAYLIQTMGLQDWAAFAEVYGMPLRLGRYGSNASPSDIRALLHAVRSISNDAAAVAPDGMPIEFHKVDGQHGAEVFGKLIDYVDRNVSKLVLGQTMTSDDGSSMAQAQIHNEVRLDILKADCKQLAQTINRDLIEPFVAFNFGPQESYPKIEFPVTEPEDIKAITDAVTRLVPFGFKVSQNTMRDKLGLAEPEEDEDLLIASGSTDKADEKPQPAKKKEEEAKLAAEIGAHVTGCQCAGCLARLGANQHEDEIDRLIDAELADWQDITDPLLSPLQAILDQAGSLEEAQKMLDEVSLDSSTLQTSLSKLTAIARGLGDASDDLPEG